MTRSQISAVQIVEPRALAPVIVEVLQSCHSSPNTHTRVPSSPRAFWATLSAVKPNFSMFTDPGAEAPKRSIVTVASA